MSEVRYYKGKYKVRVLTKSHGNWIVEALEEFQDVVHGEKLKVKVGAQRIVAPNLLFKKKALPPPPKEHTYELEMEKKLKHLIEKEKENKE
jgi:hypothetical protein